MMDLFNSRHGSHGKIRSACEGEIEKDFIFTVKEIIIDMKG
jgi:hypothetical protein